MQVIPKPEHPRSNQFSFWLCPDQQNQVIKEWASKNSHFQKSCTIHVPLVPFANDHPDHETALDQLKNHVVGESWRLHAFDKATTVTEGVSLLHFESQLIRRLVGAFEQMGFKIKKEKISLVLGAAKEIKDKDFTTLKTALLSVDWFVYQVKRGKDDVMSLSSGRSFLLKDHFCTQIYPRPAPFFSWNLATPRNLDQINDKAYFQEVRSEIAMFKLEDEIRVLKSVDSKKNPRFWFFGEISPGKAPIDKLDPLPEGSYLRTSVFGFAAWAKKNREVLGIPGDAPYFPLTEIIATCQKKNIEFPVQCMRCFTDSCPSQNNELACSYHTGKRKVVSKTEGSVRYRWTCCNYEYHASKIESETNSWNKRGCCFSFHAFPDIRNPFGLEHSKLLEVRHSIDILKMAPQTKIQLSLVSNSGSKRRRQSLGSFPKPKKEASKEIKPKIRRSASQDKLKKPSHKESSRNLKGDSDKDKKPKKDKPSKSKDTDYIKYDTDETVIVRDVPISEMPDKIKAKIRADGIKVDDLKGKEALWMWHIAVFLEHGGGTDGVFGADFHLYERGKVKHIPDIQEAQAEKARQSLVAFTDKFPQKKVFPKLDFLSEGGFGEVFTGKMIPPTKEKGKNGKMRVAVKKLQHSEDRIKYNLSELFFLSNLKHNNIVAYEAAYLASQKGKPDTVLFVMEWLEGGTLQEAAKSGVKIPDHNIAFIVRESFRGIAYLHASNYAHRDLKSPNIMLSVQGEVKLIDFGLACDISLGRRNKMLGSPMWIPPEMIQLRPHGLPVDIWSMAVCILELYLGDPPLKKTPYACMFTVATQGLAHFIPSAASANAKDLLQQCLQVEPDKRPTAAKILEHDWFKKTDAELQQGMRGVLTSMFMKQIGVF